MIGISQSGKAGVCCGSFLTDAARVDCRSTADSCTALAPIPRDRLKNGKRGSGNADLHNSISR